MFVKIFGILLLLGFVYIQLVHSLECFSCNSLQSCKSPEKITCNSANSNETTKYFSQNFRQNVTNMTSTNFNCVLVDLTFDQLSETYKGCVYDRVPGCSLVHKNPTVTKRKCKQCGTKLCNIAGTFSSNMLTVFASIVLVTVYKALNL